MKWRGEGRRLEAEAGWEGGEAFVSQGRMGLGENEKERLGERKSDEKKSDVGEDLRRSD